MFILFFYKHWNFQLKIELIFSIYDYVLDKIPSYQITNVLIVNTWHFNTY